MIGATAINSVMLMGRLTADPEQRQTASGLLTVQFTVAVTRAFKNQNGEYEADFIRCVAWRQTAEFICRNFRKGRLILIEGTLRTGSYDDRTHPDVKHYTTDVYVENVGFGETKSSAGSQGGGYQQQGGGYQQQSGGYLPQTPPPLPPPPAAAPPAMPQNTLNLEDFQEVISDGGLPF